MLLHWSGLLLDMITVSITEAKRRFYELARIVEAGVVVVVTRYGKPWFKIVRHQIREGAAL